MRLSKTCLFSAAAGVALLAPGAAFAQDARADALAYLNLQASGSGAFTWVDHTANGSIDTFTNVSVTEGGGGPDVVAATMSFDNLRMENGAAVFDSLVFEGLTVSDDETDAADAGGSDDGKPGGSGAAAGGQAPGPQQMTVARVSFVGPNPLVASNIASAMFRGEGEGIEFEGFEAYQFESIALEGLDFDFIDENGQPMEMTLGGLRVNDWSEGAIGAVALENLTIVGETDIQGQMTEVNISIGEISLNGTSLDGLQALFDAAEGGDFTMRPDSPFMSPYVKHWDGYNISNITVSVGGVNFGLASFAGSIEETSRGLEYRDNMDGLTLSFDPSGPLGAQAAMGFAMAGLDSLEFSMVSHQIADPSADRIYTEEYRISMVDGFDLDVDYDIGGMSEYLNRAVGMQDQLSDFDSPDAFASLMEPLIISRVGVTYTDRGLAPTVLQVASAFMGGGGAPPANQGGADDGKGPGEGGGETGGEAAPASDTAGLAAMVAGQIRAAASSEPPGAAQDFVMAFADAVETFITNPNIFAIAASPASPVPVAELMQMEDDPNAVVSRLNMTVSAQ